LIEIKSPDIREKFKANFFFQAWRKGTCFYKVNLKEKPKACSKNPNILMFMLSEADNQTNSLFLVSL